LKEGTRQAVRGFLKQVSAGNPHIYSNIIAAGVRSWQKNRLIAGEADEAEGAAPDL
jgi:hypothetical protein